MSIYSSFLVPKLRLRAVRCETPFRGAATRNRVSQKDILKRRLGTRSNENYEEAWLHLGVWVRFIGVFWLN